MGTEREGDISLNELGVDEQGRDLSKQADPGVTRQIGPFEPAVGKYIETDRLNLKDERLGLTAAQETAVNTRESAKKTAEVLRELQLQREQKAAGTEGKTEHSQEYQEAA